MSTSELASNRFRRRGADSQGLREQARPQKSRPAGTKSGCKATPVARSCRSLSIAGTVRFIPTRPFSCSIVRCCRSTVASGREHFAQPKQLAAPAKASALLFRINAEWLALPTQAFQEVAEHRLVHSLPHRRQGIVLGLVNIRGELLICVSLGHLLGLERTPPGQARRAGLMIGSWSPAGMGIAWSSRPMRSAASIGSRCRNSRNRRRPWRNPT